MTSETLLIWTAILLLGIGTYALRAVFLLGAETLETFPESVEETLPFVPIAILSALIAPYLLVIESSVAGTLITPELGAGLIAISVAWRTESMLYTVGIGMVALWSLQWLL